MTADPNSYYEMNKQASDVYNEGRHARLRGCSLLMNPYYHAPEFDRHWTQGWRDEDALALQATRQKANHADIEDV